ncbi:MAG: hypothetical protein MUC81_12810 [Bacteroidia bacterium]|jgi:hypothetical protein|nr:hypothetical protein [Bacteroidia bacterium]
MRILFITLIIFTLSACNKLYWHRSKVRVGKKPIASIQVKINNRAPHIFNSNFNTDLEKTCEKEFIKMGYTTSYKDTPDYIAFVTVSYDSFPTQGIYYYGLGGATLFTRHYRKEKVYAILFNYLIVHTKFKSTKWENKNDIFYFDNADRNSRRSINMVKYSIRYGK